MDAYDLPMILNLRGEPEEALEFMSRLVVRLVPEQVAKVALE